MMDTRYFLSKMRTQPMLPWHESFVALQECYRRKLNKMLDGHSSYVRIEVMPISYLGPSHRELSMKFKVWWTNTLLLMLLYSINFAIYLLDEKTGSMPLKRPLLEHETLLNRILCVLSAVHKLEILLAKKR